MSALPPVNSAVSILFQPASLVFQPRQPKSAPDSVLELSTGRSSEGNGAMRPALQAQASATRSVFDRQIPDVNEIKVNLMERLGKEFNISLDDFDSSRAFGLAIKSVVQQIKIQTDGRTYLVEIERKLGLDKLGVSIDTLIGAMIDPKGHDNEKLEAALRTNLDDFADTKDKKAVAAFLSEETGLYGFYGQSPL